MNIEDLFGDYTIAEFKELLEKSYKKETGLEPISKETHLPTFGYLGYVEDLLSRAVSELYEERALASGKAFADSKSFKKLFFNKEPLNLIGKEVKKSGEKKDYLFMVETIQDIPGLPEGSGIYVEKELKKYYLGTRSSMNGTYLVKIPKDKCRKLDEL